MRFSTLTVAVFAALVAAAPASSPAPSGKILKLDFTKTRDTSAKPVVDNPNAPYDPSKDKSNPLASLVNHQVYYDTEITLGTPPQKFTVDLDTGSSDLWVAADGRKGGYNHNISSTYQEFRSGFQIQYGDGTSATGDWVKDTITFGGASIPQFVFAAASQVSSSEQVFGIGYPANEASGISGFQGGETFIYDNFPIRLAKQGIVNTPAYSLYLNSLDSTSGSVLFGGVDSSKFTGGLAKLPILKDSPSDPAPKEFFVTLNGAEVSVGGKETNVLDKTRQVLLDSGTTLTYVPTETVQTLINTLGLAVTDQGPGATQEIIDSIKGSVVTYSLQGQKINVPVEELFFRGLDATTGKPLFIKGANGAEPFYAFLINDGGDGPFIFGDSFLRSAYVVYDLGANEVAIGQADYSGGAEKIETIAAGSDGIPSATAAPLTATWTTDEPITTTPSATQDVQHVFTSGAA